MYVYIYMYICMYIYICIYMYIYVCMYICAKAGEPHVARQPRQVNFAKLTRQDNFATCQLFGNKLCRIFYLFFAEANRVLGKQKTPPPPTFVGVQTLQPSNRKLKP